MAADLSRRRLLRTLAALPLALGAGAALRSASAEEEAVWPWEEVRWLMPGTPYETPLYLFASGRPGPAALVLGGVHGNEPGGWLAADWVAAHRRPRHGVLLVVPRANAVAIGYFERTTDWLADLNRSYPGFPDGRPMERMAAEICGAIGEFGVSLVHDMHESWAFYRDRTTSGTAFIGQTIATSGEAGAELARTVVERVNSRILYQHEEFFFREPGSQQNTGLPRQQNIPPPGRGTSSLGLNRFFPGLVTLLVEMAQQQSLERRVALHVEVLDEAMRAVGMF